MEFRPHIVNDHLKIQTAYAASIAYLESNQHLYELIGQYLWAYHEVGDLIPQTTENFWSGHFFPYSESQYELENSYILTLQGFYGYSFAALRSMLELSLVGIYFAVHDQEHIDIRPWLTSMERTPTRRAIFERISELASFRAFDQRFDLQGRIKMVFESLDCYVHTRGMSYSATKLTNANFNQFSEKSLKLYCDFLFSIIRDVLEIMLLKYPVGMQGLPIVDKFGLNGPTGGFLQQHQVDLIISLIPEDERQFLQSISDKDPNIQYIIGYINSLPDLSAEDFENQLIENAKFMIETQGLESWIENEMKMEPYIKDKEHFRQRIDSLSRWAHERGYIKSRWER